jgi:hypothetical protein
MNNKLFLLLSQSIKIFVQIDLIRLLVDTIEELTKDVEQIHKKMLDPMADSSRNIPNSNDPNRFLPL